MGSKNFPIGKLLIIGIELFVLIMANVFCYYTFTAKPVNKNPYVVNEISYDGYLSFKGTIKEIRSFNAVSVVVADQQTDWDDIDPEEYYENVDSVEIGVESINTARILVAGKEGERWFVADNSTYVYDSISDICGGMTLKTGQKVNIAYGQKKGIEGYDYVYAFKGDTTRSAVFKPFYVIGILIPSVIVLVFSIVLIITVSKRQEEGKGGRRGLIVVSILLILLSISFASFMFVSIQMAKNTETATPVRAHAPIIYLYNDSDEQINVKLVLNGNITVTYPAYDVSDGWTVTASPDGALTDTDGNNYRFLFWEADLDMDYDLSSGYCVQGSDTEEFLNKALQSSVLTRRKHLILSLTGCRSCVIILTTSLHSRQLHMKMRPV